jgi:sigma-B regulation protein RsbU (phosphoserine phosphatase)
MSLGTCISLLTSREQSKQRIAYLEELNQALMESLERIEALFDFVGRNDLTTETNQIFDALFTEARSLLQVKGLALALVNPSDHRFEISRVVPHSKKTWARREILAQIDSGIFPWVLKTRRPSLVPNLSNPEKLMTVLIPLVTAHRVIGMLLLWSPIGEREVTPHLLRMLSITARQASLALENSQLYQRVEREREALRRTGKNLVARQKKINRELNIARIIQSNLLPRQFPTTGFCRFAARYVPTSEVGGDFYDVMPLEDGSVGVVIADISGHGIPSAFGTAVLKVLLGGWVRRPRNLSETVSQLNQELKGIFEKHQYLTLFMGRIYPQTLRMEYVLAGHPPPLLFNRNHTRIRKLSSGGFLVGFDPNEKYQVRSLSLHPGDRLCCYTDGIIEIRNPDKKAYRLRRLRHCLKNYRNVPLNELPDRILQDAHNFNHSESIEDDLSILVIEILSVDDNNISKC